MLNRCALPQPFTHEMARLRSNEIEEPKDWGAWHPVIPAKNNAAPGHLNKHSYLLPSTFLRIQLAMSRAFLLTALALTVLAVVNATGPESDSEPTSIPLIPSRMKLADTVEIPYWLYVIFTIIAVCLVCQCCCSCLIGSSAASNTTLRFRAAAHARTVLQAIV